MNIKDVRGKLKPKDIQAELLQKTEAVVKFNGIEQTMSVADIKSPFFLLQFKDIETDIQIDELLISKADYDWWWRDAKHYSKLFKEETKPVIKSNALMTVGCAIITENGIEQLKVCSGTKKEIIDFINEQLTTRTLKSFGDDFIVFKFDYEDEDKHHPELWFTVEELAEKGVLKLA